MEVGRISQGRQMELPIAVNNEAVDVPKNNQSEKFKDSGELTEGKLKNSVDKLNKFLEDENVHAEYEIHDKLKDVMIKIVNSDTKEVIMEIPPKKILDMVAKMCEMVGILVDKKA